MIPKFNPLKPAQAKPCPECKSWLDNYGRCSRCTYGWAPRKDGK
jgi:hypothetical protein